MDDNYLISRLKTKYSDKDTTNFNVFDFLSAFGSPLDAIVYSKLFWPEFVEVDDMVFLKERFETEEDHISLKEVFRKYGGDRCKVEQAFNFYEIPWDFLCGRVGETTEEEDDWLAERLVEMWAACLRLLYPERRFIVKLLEPEETGGEIGIIFYQDREKQEDV